MSDFNNDIMAVVSMPSPVSMFPIQPMLPPIAVIFDYPCKMLAEWAGVVDPTNTVDSYVMYAKDTRILVYIHSSGIDCDEIMEVIVEGNVTDDGVFVPDKAVSFTPTPYVPMEYLIDIVENGMKKMIGVDDVLMDRMAFANAKSWFHPSLLEAHPVLNKRHAILSL